MEKPLNVGLIGFGNIGAGVVDLLDRHGDLIAERAGRPIRVTRIADLDVATKRKCRYGPAILSKDVNGLLADSRIDAVVELIGGYEPARSFVERALASGKHVVTANKAMLSRHVAELLAGAPPGVALLYEAAVGGGIPLIRTLHQGLAANQITSIRGIINGTTNYILTAMESEVVLFEEALQEAQQLGYAEPDPKFDTDGTDVAHKISLLASLCFGMDIRCDDILVEGIEELAPIDFVYARELDYRIKLLGIAKRESPGAAAEVRVSPTLLPKNSMLASVSGVFNAIEIVGDPVGPILLYGRGAGPKPTASAVVSDLMALASAPDAPLALARETRLSIPLGVKNLKPDEEIETEYYLRFHVTDRPGTMAALSKALGDRGISIKSMIQHGEERTETAAVIIITHSAREGAIQEALEEICRLKINRAAPFVLRVEGA